MDKLPDQTKEGTQEGSQNDQRPADSAAEPLKEAFSVYAAKVRSHVDQMVRETVEQTLNSLLDAEADRLTITNATWRLNAPSCFHPHLRRDECRKGKKNERRVALSRSGEKKFFSFSGEVCYGSRNRYDQRQSGCFCDR